MSRTTQAATTETTAAAETTTQTPASRTRRGRGRRRVGTWVRPVYPIRALYDAATEEERRQAHVLSANILEYWTGLTTKQELARRLSVPPIRVWQLSQRAATGLVCGLLTPPQGRRGPPMKTSPSEKELAKRIAQLERENQLQRELIEVLRELPGNRDREIPGAPSEAAQEAEATKPRRSKSRPRHRAVPEAPGVAPPTSPPPR